MFESEFDDDRDGDCLLSIGEDVLSSSLDA